MTSNAENREKCAEALADVPAEDKAKMAAMVAGPDGLKMATEEKALRKSPRDRINVDAIIDRLYADITGDMLGGKKMDAMTPTQVRAAEILLNKRLPNLQATQISGDGDGGGITINIVKNAN